MYCGSLQVFSFGLLQWTSVRYILWFSSGIVPLATTVDFGQAWIVFLYRYCTKNGNTIHAWPKFTVVSKIKYLKRNTIHTLPKSMVVAQGTIPVEKHNTYLTEVHSRIKLCFSSGIVPWATTVDFGQVCIVFLVRYCTLGYDCGLRSDMYCVSLQVF
jgi:hypothetical protein